MDANPKIQNASRILTLINISSNNNMPKPAGTTDIIIKKEISPLVIKAQALTINNTDDLKQATEILSQLNIRLKAVTDEKEKVTKPINEALKAERLRWKPIETDLEGAIKVIRDAMSAYQTEITRKQTEDEAKIANRIGTGKGKIKIETAATKLDALDKPVESVQAQSGSLKFRPKEQLKITDIKKIPREYLLPNEAAILMQLKNGANIPGCEIEVIQIPINSR